MPYESSKRYAGDRFLGPTGLPTGFPLDVADGAVLFTSGSSLTSQNLYVKVTGAWKQVTATGVVLETMTGNLIDNHQGQNISGAKVFYDPTTFNELVTINNLLVTGTQTTLNTVDSTIKDNLIILNSGESGAGITLQSGGIQIDRGTKEDASFLFNETISGQDSIDFYTGGFDFNYEAHVTGDKLVKSSETGIFQTVINSVHETGYTTTTGVSEMLLTGVSSIYDIDGVVSGGATLEQNQQIQCYIGGVVQTPARYSLSNALAGTGVPTVAFSENLFSGVRADFIYSASTRAV